MGIAISLKGSDFSMSNIGQVTFAPTKKEIISTAVNDYYSSVGDVGNMESISSLVTTLVYNDLWDKIKVIYPVLGTTLEQQCVDLKGVQDLIPFVNATAGNNLITFSNTIGIGNVNNPESNVSIERGKRMVIVGYKRGTINNSYLIGRNNTLDFIATANSPQCLWVGISNYGQTMTKNGFPEMGNYLVGLHVNAKTNKVEYFKNSIKTELALDNGMFSINSASGKYDLIPYIGGSTKTNTEKGATIEENNFLATGKFWFYAEAELDTTEEAILVESACSAFCNSIEEKPKTV